MLKTKNEQAEAKKDKFPMSQTKNDLPEDKRKALVELLNARLADATDLFTQAKHAHWNVKGPSFIALHELFDTVAASAAEYSDLIAERAVALGGTALGTARVVAKETELPEYPLHIKLDLEHVDALSTALAAFGKAVRAGIDESQDLGDQDTADLFTEISRGVDKHLWFVEAHNQVER